MQARSIQASSLVGSGPSELFSRQCTIATIAVLLTIVIAGCGGGGGDNPPPRSTWTQLVGTLFNDVSFAIATDKSGNIFVAGYTQGGFEGIPQPANSDSVVFKYDATGARLWTRQITGLDWDAARGLATDASGNVFVAVYSDRGNYLIKSDSNGTRLWTRGIAGSVLGNGVATDVSGNAYVIGGGGTGPEPFIVMFDGAGNASFKFGTVSSAGTNAGGAAISIDASGNVFVTGNTGGNVDGNINAGGSDVFIVKYDSSGAKLWARQLGTANDDISFGVATDSSGNVYVASDTGGGIDGNINAGGKDVFIVKYDSSGTKLWARQLGTANDDHAAGVVADAGGNVYIAGSTDGALDGNTSAGSTDIFLVKYDGDGNKLWTTQTGSDVGDYAGGIAIDANGNIYVTGSTDGSLDGKFSAGSREIFIVKYDREGHKQ